MNRVYLASGSNIEPRENYLKSALNLLENDSRLTVTKTSSIYQTAPVGYTEQDDFLNMVMEIETSLTPIALLDLCQHIEKQLNRKRGIRFGPRTLDLDILVYNQENRQTERLTLPHPRMHERAFVLIPLSEIASDLTLPPKGKRISEYIEALPESDIKGVTRWTEKGSAEE
ncbi:2-amino-4-hydroxy-6-hydroxymethyldihydropteridine diphosphokinase [Lentibacillus cibarius]|uniref:2-amino-4-hydroxy-6-hydroxymethyldihydropteridine diphosphokinase n=1 Tax=Lentibacillus cibarius TaxID=2583219 RepID=A0A5S3QKS2_9BACI|nr:2-amino-4-hydroxy-6-hydroxymethyldihydropteridine diphosphokinase [Lentibacillus cibarius]TMN22349.1 2-amino-4-hydroxy-6-hydroxymethyldihydropteridine diphosphokinase [Lentibacillus cibarius]